MSSPTIQKFSKKKVRHPWVPDFKKTNVHIATRDAIWQYLVDHAYVSSNGELHILVRGIRSEQDFWYRVYAREKGGKRVDRKDVERMQFEKIAEHTIAQALDIRSRQIQNHPWKRYFYKLYVRLRNWLVPRLNYQEAKRIIKATVNPA